MSSHGRADEGTRTDRRADVMNRIALDRKYGQSKVRSIESTVDWKYGTLFRSRSRDNDGESEDEFKNHVSNIWGSLFSSGIFFWLVVNFRLDSEVSIDGIYRCYCFDIRERFFAPRREFIGYVCVSINRLIESRFAYRCIYCDSRDSWRFYGPRLQRWMLEHNGTLRRSLFIYSFIRSFVHSFIRKFILS